MGGATLRIVDTAARMVGQPVRAPEWRATTLPHTRVVPCSATIVTDFQSLSGSSHWHKNCSPRIGLYGLRTECEATKGAPKLLHRHCSHQRAARRVRSGHPRAGVPVTPLNARPRQRAGRASCAWRAGRRTGRVGAPSNVEEDVRVRHVRCLELEHGLAAEQERRAAQARKVARRRHDLKGARRRSRQWSRSVSGSGSGSVADTEVCVTGPIQR